MEKAIEFLESILKKDEKIVVACSGGADSMCLLSLVCELRKKKNLDIIVVHVDHNVRSESKRDLEFVKNYCLENNLKFESTTLDVNKDNFSEQLGHNLRYDFFKKILNKYNAHYLATAHHGDDLIETILMRINRGSTLEGYSGFKKINVIDNITFLKPLIEYTKEDILKYNANNNIKYVIDKSNSSLKYKRNRYRLNVLPFLKKEDENIHLKYLEFSNKLNEYNEFIKNYVDNLKVINNNIIDISACEKENKFIKKQVVMQVIKNIQVDDWLDISDKQIEELIKLFKGRNRQINLNNGYIGIKEYNKLIIKKEEVISSFEYELKDNLKIGNGIFKLGKDFKDNSNYTLRLDSKEIKLPLMVRSRCDGDKMQVKNLKGTKKVKDILIDEKIPVSKRNEIPVVVDSNNNILWLAGLKKSQFAKNNQEKYDIIIRYEVGE